MCFVPGQSIERVVAYARGKGQQRFGALIPKNLYGTRATAAFRDAVTKAGGTLVAIETYDRSATALSGAARRLANRSEEHTSELQSLMRISYAVFCLQKKTTTSSK